MKKIIYICIAAIAMSMFFAALSLTGCDNPWLGAVPGSVGIGGEGGNNNVQVTGVTLNKTTFSLAAGDHDTLHQTVAPENATNKAVTWSTSNASVATVNDGLVTGVASGTATITVTTADGNKTAACTVTVPAPPASWTAIPAGEGAGNSTFGTTTISSITYGGAAGSQKFVAVGASGKMAYSSNGTSWTAIPAGTGAGTSTFDTSTINSITYGGAAGSQKFVAVGDSGKMAHSSDGITWTAVGNSTLGTSIINGINYGGGMFVAVGASGKMAHSDDGITWTAVTDSTFNATTDIYSISYGGNKWVAGGASGRMAYSTNGTSWAAVTDSKFGASAIRGIAYGGGRFAAVGESGKIVYSADGETWTAVTDSKFGTAVIRGIAYGGGRFAAVGNSGIIAYSTDGETWTAVTESTFGTAGIRNIAYGNSMWIAVGTSGRMAYSTGD